ncbi:MAG: MlaD family protein [Planctomycetota bacterium]
MEPRRWLRLALGVGTLAVLALGGLEIWRVLQRGPGDDRVGFAVLFKDAAGLRPGSALRYRGMDVGEVLALDLDAEAGRVRASVAVRADLVGLLRTTTQCWIVRPRFGGLAGDLSGLDTLIKDSYLRLRERPGGERLAPGGELFALEGPPDDLREGELDDPGRGDLVARVLLPDPHGLAVGSPVLFRGLEVGEVRRIRLATDGRGVLVTFRVAVAYRPTLREASRVWVSRPVLHGNLLTGITASKLGSLLRPALAYDRGEDEDSGPCPDDALLVGVPTPPATDEDWDRRAGAVAELEARPRATSPGAARLAPRVEVRYTAVEVDTFEDDQLAYHGDGLLFVHEGQLFALCARSICDGGFVLEGSIFDRIKIRDEKLRVHLGDGRVLPATRVWTAPDDGDLALLRVDAGDGGHGQGLPPWPDYLDFRPRDGAAGLEQAADGALLGEDGRFFGVAGQGKAGSGIGRRLSCFDQLPAELRPMHP